MAALTAPGRALRLDEATWQRLAAMATPAGAGLVLMGAYLVLAFDRFGFQAFIEVRASARMLLIGLYGWAWLVGGAWVIARMAFSYTGSASRLAPLMAHAYVPLLLLALFIQFVSVAANISGLAFWLALFAGGFWMPAMLVAAAGTATGLGRRSAIVVAGVPYLVWVVVVGRPLWLQMEHLL